MSDEPTNKGGDYLEKCVPWTGEEKDLPTGVIGLPAGIDVLDLVKTVAVFDDSTETGLAEIKPAEVKKGMKLANAKMWESRIEAIGPAGIRIIDPDGGQHLTRFPVEGSSVGSWWASVGVDGLPRHTDGLAMWAIRRLRMKIMGGGVQF